MQTTTKGEFARMCGVQPSAVSNWIKRRILDGDALVGTGRSVRINVEVARAQARLRRDIGQACGNGLDTRLGPPLTPAPVAAPTFPTLIEPPPRFDPPATDFDPVEERIKREKLEGLERTNRIAAAKEAADAGRYVEAPAARREMARIAAGMVTVLEQALDTFATAVAERFQVPQRDALHLLKGEFRKVRERAAEAHARQAEALPRTVEVADEPIKTGAPADAADAEPDDTD